jgi:hypothetical protein
MEQPIHVPAHPGDMTNTRIQWRLHYLILLFKRPDGSRVAFHRGDSFQFKAFVAIDLDNDIAVVYFANGVEGLRLIMAIVEPVVGDLRVVRDWLGYEEDQAD